MSTISPPDRAPTARSPRPAGVVALLGASTFLGAYLLNDVVRSAATTRPLPLPNAPDAEIHGYVVGESMAMAMPAVMHLVSAAGLTVFLIAAGRVVPALTEGRAGRWATVAGVVAVAALTVSAALGITLAIAAPGLSFDSVLTLNTAAFLAGGVVHVASLGVVAGLYGRALTARGIRILAIVASVVALLSLLSLVWFYATAFILLGRLLCMLWIVVTAVAFAWAAVPSRVLR